MNVTESSCMLCFGDHSHLVTYESYVGEGQTDDDGIWVKEHYANIVRRDVFSNGLEDVFIDLATFLNSTLGEGDGEGGGEGRGGGGAGQSGGEFTSDSEGYQGDEEDEACVDATCPKSDKRKKGNNSSGNRSAGSSRKSQPNGSGGAKGQGTGDPGDGPEGKGPCFGVRDIVSSPIAEAVLSMYLHLRGITGADQGGGEGAGGGGGGSGGNNVGPRSSKEVNVLYKRGQKGGGKKKCHCTGEGNLVTPHPSSESDECRCSHDAERLPVIEEASSASDAKKPAPSAPPSELVKEPTAPPSELMKKTAPSESKKKESTEPDKPPAKETKSEPKKKESTEPDKPPAKETKSELQKKESTEPDKPPAKETKSEPKKKESTEPAKPPAKETKSEEKPKDDTPPKTFRSSLVIPKEEKEEEEKEEEEEEEEEKEEEEGEKKRRITFEQFPDEISEEARQEEGQVERDTSSKPSRPPASSSGETIRRRSSTVTPQDTSRRSSTGLDSTGHPSTSEFSDARSKTMDKTTSVDTVKTATVGTTANIQAPVDVVRWLHEEYLALAQDIIDSQTHPADYDGPVTAENLRRRQITLAALEETLVKERDHVVDSQGTVLDYHEAEAEILGAVPRIVDDKVVWDDASEAKRLLLEQTKVRMYNISASDGPTKSLKAGRYKSPAERKPSGSPQAVAIETTATASRVRHQKVNTDDMVSEATVPADPGQPHVDILKRPPGLTHHDPDVTVGVVPHVIHDQVQWHEQSQIKKDLMNKLIHTADALKFMEVEKDMPVMDCHRAQRKSDARIHWEAQEVGPREDPQSAPRRSSRGSEIPAIHHDSTPTVRDESTPTVHPTTDDDDYDDDDSSRPCRVDRLPRTKDKFLLYERFRNLRPTYNNRHACPCSTRSSSQSGEPTRDERKSLVWGRTVGHSRSPSTETASSHPCRNSACPCSANKDRQRVSAHARDQEYPCTAQNNRGSLHHKETSGHRGSSQKDVSRKPTGQKGCGCPPKNKGLHSDDRGLQRDAERKPLLTTRSNDSLISSSNGQHRLSNPKVPLREKSDDDFYKTSPQASSTQYHDSKKRVSLNMNNVSPIKMDDKKTEDDFYKTQPQVSSTPYPDSKKRVSLNMNNGSPTKLDDKGITRSNTLKTHTTDSHTSSCRNAACPYNSKQHRNSTTALAQRGEKESKRSEPSDMYSSTRDESSTQAPKAGPAAVQKKGADSLKPKHCPPKTIKSLYNPAGNNLCTCSEEKSHLTANLDANNEDDETFAAFVKKKKGSLVNSLKKKGCACGTYRGKFPFFSLGVKREEEVLVSSTGDSSCNPCKNKGCSNVGVSSHASATTGKGCACGTYRGKFPFFSLGLKKDEEVLGDASCNPCKNKGCPYLEASSHASAVGKKCSCPPQPSHSGRQCRPTNCSQRPQRHPNDPTGHQGPNRAKPPHKQHSPFQPERPEKLSKNHQVQQVYNVRVQTEMGRGDSDRRHTHPEFSGRKTESAMSTDEEIWRRYCAIIPNENHGDDSSLRRVIETKASMVDGNLTARVKKFGSYLPKNSEVSTETLWKRRHPGVWSTKTAEGVPVKDTLWAVVKIDVYEDGSKEYDIRKPTRTKPIGIIPSGTDHHFVVDKSKLWLTKLHVKTTGDEMLSSDSRIIRFGNRDPFVKKSVIKNS